MVWSYSRLHTYTTCPAAFKKIYIDQCDKRQNAFAQFGSMCHSILEEYEKGELAEYELVDSYEKRWGDEITEEFPMMKYGSMGERYYEDGLYYFSMFNGFPDNWEIIGAELDINYEYCGHKFIGFIDLLVRDKCDGRLVIIDHKSKNGFKNAAERDEYAIQLYLYSKWVYLTYNEYPKELIFNTFRKNEFVVLPFNEDDYQSALKWMNDVITNIYEDVDFWDKIYLQYESSGKDLSEFKYNDFFCTYLCSCRHLCDRSLEGVDAI